MKNQGFTYHHVFIFVLMSLIGTSLQATHDSTQTIFESIYAQESPEITLTTDLGAIYEKGRDEFDGTLQISGSDHIWEIEIEARGKYRRRICEFPPIRLNFKKKDLRSAGYLDFDKVKLVTHCLNTKDAMETIYKEYLAYKVYNQLTDQSFRTQLVKINYVDNRDSLPTVETWGLLLEPNDEMANRLGGILYDKYNLPADSLDEQNYVQMALFQFMIGNHDWSIEMYKNIKCLYIPEKAKYLIIPYDFDYSGWVSPEYYTDSFRNASKHPRDRVYLGKFFEDRISSVLAMFQANKKQIMGKCKAFRALSIGSRAEINGYINQFFRRMKKEADVVEFEYLLPYQS